MEICYINVAEIISIIYIIAIWEYDTTHAAYNHFYVI